MRCNTLLLLAASLGSAAVIDCAAKGTDDPVSSTGTGTPPDTDAGEDVSSIEPTKDGDPGDVAAPRDSTDDGPVIADDAACFKGVAVADTYSLPVDIIWIVDSSSSMRPAIEQVRIGLNDFAAMIGETGIDYRVIMLALRNKEISVVLTGSGQGNSGQRFAVCIPPPLAGDDDCGNGERFYHSSIDIRSTQPLEQFLGTLDQTQGYEIGQPRGGEQWKDWLRPSATKSIVVVTDDNSRLTPSEFEYYSGGTNPHSSGFRLPPGILHVSRNKLFDGYVFHGLYGWEREDDPGVRCRYPDNSPAAASGSTYSYLVSTTGGVRAKICDGASAWGPFYDAVATAVTATTKIDCEFRIPEPVDGEEVVDPTLVNVHVVDDGQSTTVGKVNSSADCGPGGGWYYDDNSNPTLITMCEATCEFAQTKVGPGKDGSIEVLMGCPSIIF